MSCPMSRSRSQALCGIRTVIVSVVEIGHDLGDAGPHLFAVCRPSGVGGAGCLVAWDLAFHLGAVLTGEVSTPS